jgi:hypothetical protein
VLSDLSFIIVLLFLAVDNKDAKGRRKIDGTPEKKALLPSDSASEETDISSRRAIINDEILALQIREEDLLKVSLKLN